MANEINLLEATRFQVEGESKEVVNKVSSVKMKVDLIKQEAIAVYNFFLKSWRPLNKSEYPEIDKQEVTSLIKFLLPVVTTN